MVTHGSIKGTKLLWISEGGFLDWTLHLLELSTFLRRMQKKIKKRFPLVAETILQSTYMDDSMGSMMSEDEAIKLIEQLKEKAGMYPRKWLSKSKKVLEETDMKDKAKQIDLSMNDLPVKTLEITWSASSYQFFFIASPLVEDSFNKKKVLP